MATSSLTLPTVGKLRLPDKLERTTKRTDDRKSWSTNNFWFSGRVFFICFLGRQRKQNSPPEGNPFISNHVRSANVEFSEIIYRERRFFDFPENLNISYRRQPQQMETANPTFLICLRQSIPTSPRPCESMNYILHQPSAV